MNGNTLTASDTPSDSEGSDWVRATYQGQTTDADHDCDLTVFDVEIMEPDEADQFKLDQNDYRETSNIVFQARLLPTDLMGTINWVLELSWGPSPQRTGFSEQEQFSSDSGAEYTKKYTAEGGKLDVQASGTTHGVTCDPKTVTAYVVGTAIPNDTIIARVKNLYDPDQELTQAEKDKLADLNWTDGICWGIIVKESSTMQFYNQTVENYPVERMPYVSDDDLNGKYGDDNDGSHVGLMQVVTTKARAWDWQVNTAYGVGFYEEKLSIALNHWQNVKDSYPDATKWTAQQLEDNTSGHYRFGTGRGWYLIWGDEGKEWDPTGDAQLKAYVEDVRANAVE